MRAAPAELIAFCEREYPRLVGSLGLYCGDRHVAEDIAHEALVRVARDWGRVRSMRSPQAWTHRVAINLANSHYRRRQAEARANERSSRGADGVHHDADPGDAVAVRAAVSRLPQRQRPAVVLPCAPSHRRPSTPTPRRSTRPAGRGAPSPPTTRPPRRTAALDGDRGRRHRRRLRPCRGPVDHPGPGRGRPRLRRLLVDGDGAGDHRVGLRPGVAGRGGAVRGRRPRSDGGRVARERVAVGAARPRGHRQRVDGLGAPRLRVEQHGLRRGDRLHAARRLGSGRGPVAGLRASCRAAATATPRGSTACCWW